MNDTRAALTKAGVPNTTQLQVSADAGYFSAADLTYAADNRALVDVLAPEPPSPLPRSTQCEFASMWRSQGSAKQGRRPGPFAPTT